MTKLDENDRLRNGTLSRDPREETHPYSPGASTKRTDPRPELCIASGKLPELVDQAEDILLRSDPPEIFQREGQLVRAIRHPKRVDRKGIRREEGALVLCPVDEAYLVDLLGRMISWKRLDGRSEEWRAIDCPPRVARAYLARPGKWRVLVLRGVIAAPTLRKDGSILEKPGYDLESCLVFDPGGTQFDPIPADPTLDQAKAALSQLNQILGEFPWVDPSDRSTALAAILTALVRPALTTAPLFAFRAPTMGSGKSLLANIVAWMATGRPAPAMSQGKDEEEERKRILSILLAGDPIVCIDNVERTLGGASLCLALTGELFQGRLLGTNKMACVPTATTWLATGNNLEFEGDLTTRVLPCDLDPQCERPEERKFSIDPRKYVAQHRGRIAPAALTILRAYVVAGRPHQGLPVFGRFEEWSEWVRSALVWCGEADPCEGRSRIERADPVRRQLHLVLRWWYERNGSELLTTAEVIRRSTSGSDEKAGSLREALRDVCASRGDELSARKLGKWLARYDKRIAGDYRIERCGDSSGAILWKVRRISEGDGDAS